MISEFQKEVYSLCRKVPKGKVTTYGEIAKVIGKTGLLSRAVGTALNKNPFAPKIPCHRVVKSDGSVGGFASGTGKKIDLLRKEGITIKDCKIMDFKKRLFRL
jgi:O-6-methylguanine DNA methyltransferase